MIRTRATLLATATALAAVISGGIAAANADSGASGATGASGMTGSSGSTGGTGATGAGMTGAAATITVNGAGFATVDQSAPSATVQADYLGALEGAVTDAHTKAAALATALGDSLGPVQNLVEQTNDSDGCTGPVVFGASGAAKATPTKAAPGRRPHRHVRTRKVTAHAAGATASTCTLEADVTVTYAMS